eukprot:1721810-Amphidinium_carterae.1
MGSHQPPKASPYVVGHHHRYEVFAVRGLHAALLVVADAFRNTLLIRSTMLKNGSSAIGTKCS